MINNFEKINKSLIKRNRSEKPLNFWIAWNYIRNFSCGDLSSIFIEGKKLCEYIHTG